MTLHYHRIKNTNTFRFYFEGTAQRFAKFLEEWNIAFDWFIDLDAGTNDITVRKQ